MTKRDLFGIARAIDVYCQRTPSNQRENWPVRWSVALMKTRTAIFDFLKEDLEFARTVPETRKAFDNEHAVIIQKFTDKDEKGAPKYKIENGARIPEMTGDNQTGYQAEFKTLLEKYPTMQQEVTDHNAATEERMGVEVAATVAKALVMKVSLDALDAGGLKLSDEWVRALEPMIEV